MDSLRELYYFSFQSKKPSLIEKLLLFISFIGSDIMNFIQQKTIQRTVLCMVSKKFYSIELVY